MTRSVPSPRSPRSSPQSRKRSRRGLLILALGLLALGAGLTVWQEQRPRGDAPRPLEAWVPSGWRIHTYPDDPGPFLKIGESVGYERGHTGAFTYRNPEGLVSHRFPVRDDAEQMALLLKTPDGTLTLAILER